MVSIRRYQRTNPEKIKTLKQAKAYQVKVQKSIMLLNLDVLITMFQKATKKSINKTTVREFLRWIEDSSGAKRG